MNSFIEHYQKIRLNFIICICLSASIDLLALFNLFFEYGNLFFVAFLLMTMFLFHGANYYYSYQKQGTKFLTFAVAVALTNLVRTIMPYLNQNPRDIMDLLTLARTILILYIVMSNAALLEVNRFYTTPRNS